MVGLSTRLTGKVCSLMSDIRMSKDDYDEVKDKLLKAAGYTPKQAAVKFHHTKYEDIKCLSADQGVDSYSEGSAHHTSCRRVQSIC